MYGNNMYRNPFDNQINAMQQAQIGYVQQPTQPTQPITNVINANSNQNIDFEARILNENETVDTILVNHRTLFIDEKNGVISIKELNGDISKQYQIIVPKDAKDLKIEELENALKRMENKINEYTNANANDEVGKSDGNVTKSNKK